MRQFKVVENFVIERVFPMIGSHRARPKKEGQADALFVFGASSSVEENGQTFR
jgi:hypothetical protein